MWFVFAALCCWCGTWKGEKLCSSCRRARYCFEKHQVMHWCSGHKVDCRRISISSQSPSSTDSNSRNTLAEIDKAKALPWQHQIHQCPSQQGWQCTPLTLVCLLCNGSNIQWPEVVYAFGVLLLELLMGKCLSLTNNAGGGTIMDLLSWVHLVVREEWMAEVFDPQMVEMPQIAMVCTLVVSDQQLRMGQVAKMIEEVVGVEGSCPHDSFDVVSDSLSMLEDAGRVSFLQIVEKLLIVVVADADVSVLQSVFLSQHGNGGFDEFLAQVDSLSAIFVALNDEKECLHMQFEEKQKLLEEQRAEIQASLAMAENTLIEARKQYDLMLQGKQLELTKHLKEISQRNDQIEVLLGKTEKFDDLMVVVVVKGRQLETIKHDGKP